MAVHQIETKVGEYIRDNYKSAVEIGFGGKTTAAEIVQNAGHPILCTDVHSYAGAAVPAVVDDVFLPTLTCYAGADVLYAIRPGTEIIPPMIELARRINADLIVYHLGFELYEDGGERLNAKGIQLHRYVKRS
ncbi:hypothetical protein McpCs1_02370 [Methanocorpusculaceae archaeon Cs1]|uniref:UPF0146 protein McpCs1_02370 n=1 Tax=Methanorbis rubei TaxID=3028300 RepID=A0AAE4MD88_9EURY|nr:hypothetical protein [Methanocorpusculaceae archaeon Cs1]